MTAELKRAVRAGHSSRPDWAVPADSSGGGRFTFYVELMARQDVNGNVSDFTVDDAGRLGRRGKVITLALLKKVTTGKHRGELRRLTRTEFEDGFEELVDEAVRRHGVIPAGRNPLRSAYRHKEA